MSKTKSRNAPKPRLIDQLWFSWYLVRWITHNAVAHVLLLPIRVLREPMWVILKPFIREWKHK